MKSLSALLRGVTSNHNGDIFGLIFFTRIEQKKNLKSMKEYAMIMIFVM